MFRCEELVYNLASPGPPLLVRPFLVLHFVGVSVGALMITKAVVPYSYHSCSIRQLSDIGQLFWPKIYFLEPWDLVTIDSWAH